MYFNEKEFSVLAGEKSEFDQSWRAYVNYEEEPANQLALFPQLSEVFNQFDEINTDAELIITEIFNQMTQYEQSLKSLQIITGKRTQITTLDDQQKTALTQFVSETAEPKAQKLVYDMKSAIERGASVALQMSFTSNLEDFQASQKTFLAFVDEYSSLGFKMLNFTCSDSVFKDNMQSTSSLVTELINVVTAEGGVGPVQNNYLQLRASLSKSLMQSQRQLEAKADELNEIAKAISTESKRIFTHAEEAGNQSIVTLAIAASVVLIACIIIGFLIIRSIRYSLGRVRSFIASVGAGDLTTLMESIGILTQESTVNINEVTSGVESLNSVAKELDRAVRRFKV